MGNQRKSESSIDLSIIITAHAEGILLHKTLASVRRALAQLSATGVHTEIIIHADNPTAGTTDYLRVHKAALSDTHIYTNHFGDLGSSRNFAVTKASGKYVTFIDADDLMSEHWLERAYQFLEDHEFGKYVAHTEFTLEFGGADSLVIKHGEINRDTDTLLSVFANRWNSIIMAPRQLLLEEPYTPNSPGYGYEDWHLNCRFIAKGIHNVLIPESAIFVRRKDSDSEWLRQKTSYSVLPANPLFSFDNIRKLPRPSTAAQATETSTSLTLGKLRHIKNGGVRVLRRVPVAERAARRIYSHYRRAIETTQRPSMPSWLVEEWRSMHAIEKRLFPTQHLLDHIAIYDSLTPEHYKTGLAYKKLVDYATKDHYDYVLFVPWLLKGGADLVSINYANTIASLRPDKHVLVIATLPVESEWTERLEGVDFMPLGLVTDGLARDVKFRLLEQIVENSGATHLHIINSELGYDFAESHQNYLQSTGKRLIVTSFSQSTDDTGKIFGYSHTHVPKVYEQSVAVTTDNMAVTKMWANEYGFDPSRLIVHYQPVTEQKNLIVPPHPIRAGSLKILWAARLSPEKQPAILSDIGHLLEGENVEIDMYGTPDHGFDLSFLQTLPPNVHYKGPFNGFFSLPLEHYDAYLYTSLFDGMPNAILEAALAQLPIISSGVGGVPDFICDKQEGLVIDDLRSAEKYADAIRDLLQQPDLLALYAHSLHKKLLTRHSPTSYRESIKTFLVQVGY